MADSASPIDSGATLKPGSCIEVFGLESEGGRLLNGQKGIILCHLEGKGRFEIRLDLEKIVSMKPDNLKSVDLTEEERLRILGRSIGHQGETPRPSKDPVGGQAGEPPATTGSTTSAAGKPAMEQGPPKVGDRVEIYGLESESGRQLNGQKGLITQFVQSRGRFEVRLGPEKLVSLRSENLRRCEQGKTRASPIVGKKNEQQPKAASLASLLSMGRSEPKPEQQPKPAVWQSVWERSGSKAASGTLNSEQMAMFQEMQAEEARREEDQECVRREVTAELTAAGAFNEEMLEKAFKQRWDEFELHRLLRPQDAAARRKARRSSSSSSRSRSGSRSRRQ